MSSTTLTLPQAFRRALAAFEAARLEEAAGLCNAILGAVPDHADALHLLALVQQRRGRRLEALACYDRAVPLAGGNAALHNNRGNVLKELGRVAEALASYDAALAIRPRYPEALANRGAVLNDLKRYEEALASFAAALAVEPRHVEALNNRGNTFKEQRRFEEALASYDAALAIRPDYPEALSNRGNALYALKRHAAALASYDRALAIRPDYADAHTHRGNVLKTLRRFDEALASYARALAIRPDDALAHCNRGLTLLEVNRSEEALASFGRALEIAPGHADALNGRGNALKERRRLGEAAASYERAVAADPDHEFAFSNLADCALRLCDWTLQDRLAGQLAGRAALGKAPVMPLAMPGYGDDEGLHLACARHFIERQFAVLPAPLWNGEVWHNERIRLAYLSADFRQHPVAQLTARLFETHDRSRFETIGISFGPDDRSGLRARLIAGFDQFHDVGSASDRDAAGLLRALQVDIAIDLTGYTMGFRPEILAHRPAPIAVSYLGYPATMAAPFIDYIIADAVVLPAHRQPFYTEHIVHLPDCFMVNDPQAIDAEPAPARSAAGLPDGAFVFCCFNNHAKITAPVFEVWMRLLGAVEGSVLWLAQAGDAVAASLRSAAAARGIAPARLVFATRTAGLADHLARHDLADLFLDTLPYNAHTTACDALWAGLPVLTCRGASFAGRVAASLNAAVGLADLVTENLAEYEAAALRLARQPEALAAVRARLARNRTTWPLFDCERFRHHIESAYITMWERWQRGERPRGFSVAPQPRRDAAVA